MPPKPSRYPPKKSKSLKTAKEFLDAGLTAKKDTDALKDIEKRYSVLAPAAFVDLIESPDDPIARQVIPSPQELEVQDFESADPISDEAFSPVKGIVHRYPDRALLKPVLACPLYCRFCFRREHVGPQGDGTLSAQETERALEWIKATPQIREVVLSGGDPMILSPAKLGFLLKNLDAVPHVDNIRIHTRVPVAAPERVTDELTAIFARLDTATWLVAHVNHAKEITDRARRSLRALSRAGVGLLSQSVLLKGVNDTPQDMEELLRALLKARVKPYYLHHLDPARGTSHFRVPVARGLEILRALRGKISGTAWPTYVVDLPGGKGKVPLGPSYYLTPAGPNEGERALSPDRHVVAFK